MLNFPVGGNLIPCVPNLQISSFLGIWSVQVTSYWLCRRSEDTSFKCLHKGILYSFIQFCKKRKFRIKACLLSWNCCLLKEPVHNFSSCFFFHLLSFFSCCCVAAFQNFFVVFWIGCLVIKQWCLFFISLNYTHFGSYLLKIRFLGGIRWGYRLELNFFLGASERFFWECSLYSSLLFL